MAEPAIKTTTTEARIDSLTLRDTGWSGAARRDALARLRAMGLPERRDEYWKFTRPDTLNAPTPDPATPMVGDDTPVFGAVDRLKIVFIDGVFHPRASDDLALEGIEISRLADTAETDIHWAKDLYGTLEASGQTPVPRPHAALNTA